MTKADEQDEVEAAAPARPERGRLPRPLPLWGPQDQARGERRQRLGAQQQTGGRGLRQLKQVAGAQKTFRARVRNCRRAFDGVSIQ